MITASIMKGLRLEAKFGDYLQGQYNSDDPHKHTLCIFR